MQTLSKKEVGNWVLLDYAAQKQVIEEKLRLFSKKYQLDFASFEAKVNPADSESFDEWDDYIEWSANLHFLKEILTKIEDIRNGDFQMA